MKEDQIYLVKKSWRILRQIDPHLLGGVFYDKLFADHPSLKRMFRTSMDKQSQKLIDMLSVVVMHLDQSDTLSTELKALAIRHVKYGATPEHYKAVGGALLWTLRRGLGSDWNDELEAAWLACYAQVSQVMMNATTI